MGLTFSVANPADVFFAKFAKRVAETLATHYPGIVLDSADTPYYTSELGWSGWRLLQERAVATVGAERVPHFLSMAAWCGCFVPTAAEPGSFQFDGEKTPLAVASLPELVSELETLGAAIGLPVDDEGLKQLATKYDDDDLVDDDMDLQTYAQLLLAAHVAQRRSQILWVVK